MVDDTRSCHLFSSLFCSFYWSSDEFIGARS